MQKIRAPMRVLIEGDDLPEIFLDHPLKGNWKGCRDLHIQPDWILIYRLIGKESRHPSTSHMGVLYFSLHGLFS